MSLKKKFIFINKNRVYLNNLILGYSKKRSGCNFSGKKTVRFRGCVNRKKKRVVDYFRAFWHVKSIVLNFEYDPNRNTLLNLILYFNGIFSYIISFESCFIGMHIQNGYKVSNTKGNNTLLKCISKSNKISNIETFLSSGSKMIRSSGLYAKLCFKNFKICTVKLSSKKKKFINVWCSATVGSVFNFNFYLKRYKKAGLSRLKGFKSKVRGVAMNPVDHPHGGGEGKKSKNKNPKSPWGKSLNFKKNA